MKKLLFAAALAAISLGNSSCLDKYTTCECSTITDIPKNSLSDNAFYAACVAADAVDRSYPANGTGCTLH